MAKESEIGFLEEVKKAVFHDDKRGKSDEFIMDGEITRSDVKSGIGFLQEVKVLFHGKRK